MAAAGAVDEELASGRIVAGRYRIEGLIGHGGMGRVYRAVDEQLGRAVALKLLRVAGDGSLPPEEAARRLLREARAAAAFTHPNAVAVYDVGDFEGSPFIAMELVRGRTLRAAVGDAKVPLRERLRWLAEVARALAAAHRAALVHRDVKPDNVIVADDGAVKLLDFGIARRLPGPIDAAAATERDGTITVEGTLVGTPAYMAPEQLRAEKVDGRADQFSWGVMAYELLSGRKPWGTTSAAELIAAVLSKPAPPLAVAGVPAQVVATIDRAMAKRAGDRFATMDALVAALGSAEPAPSRARALVVAGAVVVVVSALIAVGVVRLLQRDGVKRELAGPVAVKSATPAAAPLRFYCADRAKVPPCTQDGESPWCDHDGNFLACCARGLVALGHDGMCGCPKGGTTKDGSCPPALHSTDEYSRRYLSSATRRATEPCGVTSRSVGFSVHVDPDGRIFDATIDSGATADEEVQRCMIEALRKLELDPPPNGVYSVGYGPLPH